MNHLKEILLPLAEEIKAERAAVELGGLWGAAKALLLLSLQRETGRPVIVITAATEESETLLEDLRFFSAHPSLLDTILERTDHRDVPSAPPLFLPPWGVLPFEADSPDSGTVGERMRALYGLLSAGGVFVVPLRSLIQKLPPWDLFAGSVITLRAGTRIDPEDFVRTLISIGYESASLVTRVGECGTRGGIIDLFSPSRELPIRLELFGDSIESLREFDPETQRSVRGIGEAVVLPVRELFLSPEALDRFSSRITDDMLLEQVRQGVLPAGIEFLSPFFHELDSLFRYLPDSSILVSLEPDDIAAQMRDELARVHSGRSEETAAGRVLPEAEELYLNSTEIEASLSRFPRMNLRLLSTDADSRSLDTRSAAWMGLRLTRAAAPGQSGAADAEGTVPGMIAKLQTWRKTNRIIVAACTEESRQRISRLLGEYGLATTSALPPPPDTDSSAPLPITVLTGRLSAGFSWPELGLMMISEEDIFGGKAHRSRPPRTTASPFLAAFRELKPGDFVVHRDYGVGEYLGLSHISVDGFETDFLALRYEPDAKLYVPLYSLDKVQKYTGAEGVAPRLNRLGAPAWSRTKESVKKDLLAMARQLISVSAAREAQQRPSFTPPDNLYREFESAFPYEETADQERAIEDVLEDMRRPRPMDRLVCGDVGYGKTEVALRAAFKAVEDGFQVAVLVPTTLLADQHLRMFRERLAPFSVRIEMLSRFRTRQEQQATVKGLRTGVVDIVIGTHRLLQKDVSFRNLGLLVVDEEHRFGVRHKERIKEFKQLVDVLTLTATPIPRTLHLSLAGLRDLSIIQTPPLDRQSIQVVLARFGKRVIREAILQELDRGGQVFFVHNRVQGIERMADYLRGLVPGAGIGIAHGQMKDDSMEETMSRFISGDIRVLVSTAIIESGIDIPNANTIIINRADRFGLAELYQIKGRVGRGNRKAFAYLLTPEDEALSDVARKRLRAIQELSELGAGFRIAAQDLEARGAGNLLGKQQSGHIAAVGIDLYTELMEETVAELNGTEPSALPDTQVNLRASAFIPERYIGDMSLRLAAYKEISSAAGAGEVDRITEDLVDRYGALPEPAVNLLEIMKIKVLAQEHGVARIDGGTGFVVITFSDGARVQQDKVMALLKRSPRTITLVPEQGIRIALPDATLGAAADAVKKCLQALR